MDTLSTAKEAAWERNVTLLMGSELPFEEAGRRLLPPTRPAERITAAHLQTASLLCNKHKHVLKNKSN